MIPSRSGESLYTRTLAFWVPERSLDRFKESNGFVKYLLPRRFLPLSRKGKVLLKLGLYPEPQDLVPDALKSVTIPLYNALSRKLRL